MSREIKVSLLFIVAAVILWFGFNYLKGKNTFSSDQAFYSIYNDVNLLVPGNQVLLNGMGVGLVEAVELQNDGSGLIRVDFTVKGDIKIPNGTAAEIFDVDFLGGKAVKLKFPKQFEGFQSSGDKLKSTLDAGIFAMVESELLPLKDDLTGTIKKVDTLLSSLNAILGTGELQNTLSLVNKTMGNLEKSTGGLDGIIADKNAQLTRILDDVEVLTDGLATNQDKIDNMVDSANNFAEQLNEIDLKTLTSELENTLSSANKSLSDVQAIMNQIKSGKGTIGALLYDDDMYANLEKASADLDKLLIDLKENPSRYVSFALINRGEKGKKEKKRKKDNQ